MFGSNKLILTRGGDFIGQGYACNHGLFVLHVTYDVPINVGNASFSAQIAEPLGMWHVRCAYLNMAYIKKVKQMCLFLFIKH